MEIRNLATFLKAAELLNFSKTAEALNYTQSAITTQIKQLEDELGAKLFDRTHSKVSLTKDGKSFIPYAAKIMRGVNEAICFKEEKDLVEGKLNVGCGYTVISSILLKLLPYFLLKYPKIETSIMKRSSKELTQKLLQNDLDLIFFTGAIVNNDELTKVMKLAVDTVFVASVSHRFAGKHITFSELIGEQFILTETDMCCREDLEQLFSLYDIPINIAMELSDTLDVIKLLPSTNCISFLPYHLVKESVDNGQISIIDVTDVNIKTYIQLIHRSAYFPTLAMQAMIRTVKAYCDSAEVWGVLQLNKNLSNRIAELEAL